MQTTRAIPSIYLYIRCDKFTNARENARHAKVDTGRPRGNSMRLRGLGNISVKGTMETGVHARVTTLTADRATAEKGLSPLSVSHSDRLISFLSHRNQHATEWLTEQIEKNQSIQCVSFRPTHISILQFVFSLVYMVFI